MSEKKNIDRLFQEKFKDFEAMPPVDAWNNIEARLEDKKKRRIIPFWWKLSGVAAIFVLGFLISQVFFTKNGINAGTTIVNQENPNKNNTANPKSTNKVYPVNTNGTQTESSVANSSNDDLKTNSVGSPNNKVNSTTVVESEYNGEINNSSSSGKNRIKSVSDRKKRISKSDFNSKSAVAEQNTTNDRHIKNKLNRNYNKKVIVGSTEKQQNKLVQNIIHDTKQSGGKEVVQNRDTEKNNNQIQAVPDQKPINLDDLKGSINSKIATKEITQKVNDTVAANSVATNELEKLLNEKESKLKQESKMNRWQLTSNVAPVFLGSISGGSPIDSTLSRNSKAYNTNVGYGIGVSYALNKKLSIRTGLNKVNMSYDTRDITFFTGIQAKSLANVSPAASSAMIHVESNISSTTTSVTSENTLLPFENSLMHKSTGLLRQEIGYLEMPLEMTYNVFDRKFGLKIIGGFSTMFLQDNKILIISENRDTVLGKANNLNDMHFSTNFGLGMKYSFYKAFEFNVEPTIKYQLNTYSSNSGNFKPYLFGIYSGISYKF